MDFSPTRHLDGSPIEAPMIRSESLSSDWTRPQDVAELLGRVHPNGAPEFWTRFFAGEEVADAERDRIRAALRDYADPPASPQRGQNLIRTRNRIEIGLKGYSWLDTDHQAVVNPTCEQLAAAVSARAALDLQLRSIKILIEQNDESERARVRYASDRHLLWKLSEAIVNAPASFSDEYAYLLPAATVERIERSRERIRREAKKSEEEREAQRLKQIEDRERERLERLADVQSATIEDLLGMLFEGKSDQTIPNAIRRREITFDHFQTLIALKAATGEPVARRAYGRLIEFASTTLQEIALNPPTEEEIEAARQARLLQEEEAEKKRVDAYIKSLDESQWPALCAEVIKRNLIPGEWQSSLHLVTDFSRVQQYRQYFIDRAGRETDPVNRRLCELMAQNFGKRF